MGFDIPFACPRCRTPLQLIAVDELLCPADGLRFERRDGIWRFLLPERVAVFEQFIHEYETIRHAEGRGAADPAAYVRALPYFDLSGRMSADWRIRAASFDAFFAQIFRPLERPDVPLTVLDLGAGNGWLSNRLAGRGHHLIAVDLMTNDFDGLGCHRYFEHPFTPAQAEFEHLPLIEASADLVVFNASLHYAADFGVTLAESLRVLKPGGRLVILDSPIYHKAASGAQMVKERETQFLKKYGFPSNALPSKNYLTYDEMKELGKGLHVHWQMLTPFYGFSWLLKPIKAKLLGRREPAGFHIIMGKR
jgi:SAM-dependent methyltransferase/uncharacterized protein YbaR (Trm112 family)